MISRDLIQSRPISHSACRRCRGHARRRRPLTHALAVLAGHGARAGHHAAGPGPNGTASAPLCTPATPISHRPHECVRGHTRGLREAACCRRPRRPLAAPRMSHGCHARCCSRCSPLRPLLHEHALPSVAPALPHAAAAPSHTPHVLHVVVWPMETGASRHLALVLRQQHLHDGRGWRRARGDLSTAKRASKSTSVSRIMHHLSDAPQVEGCGGGPRALVGLWASGGSALRWGS